MSIELIVESAAWIISIGLLILLVPIKRIREAIVVFLFKQTITWLFGLIVVELRLIEYPVRLLNLSTKASFTFEYFVYPVLCILFVLYYPNGKSLTRQFMHYFYFSSAITVIEVLCEKYTDLIHYIHWNWFLSWITLFITFLMSKIFYDWFFGSLKSDNQKQG
jgi:hypothetical protein